MRALAVAAALTLVACGGDEDPIRPQVGKIAPAMAAVDAELGGPQSYFEVTAEPQAVVLFVAVDEATSAVRYVYIGDELAPAGAPQGGSGGTFTAAAVTFDPDGIFDQLDADLDDPDIVQFSIAGNAVGEVQYAATVQSDAGGLLDVVVGPDGTVRSVTGG